MKELLSLTEGKKKCQICQKKTRSQREGETLFEERHFFHAILQKVGHLLRKASSR